MHLNGTAPSVYKSHSTSSRFWLCHVGPRNVLITLHSTCENVIVSHVHVELSLKCGANMSIGTKLCMSKQYEG